MMINVRNIYIFLQIYAIFRDFSTMTFDLDHMNNIFLDKNLPKLILYQKHSKITRKNASAMRNVSVIDSFPTYVLLLWGFFIKS